MLVYDRVLKYAQQVRPGLYVRVPIQVQVATFAQCAVSAYLSSTYMLFLHAYDSKVYIPAVDLMVLFSVETLAV